MKTPDRKQLVWIGAGAVLLLLLLYGFLPDPVPVQTATVERGPLRVSIEEEGVTRVTDHFEGTAPTTAYMRRVELEAGDRVQRGQTLVEFEPARPADLDPRTRQAAVGRVSAARAGLESATEQARAANVGAEQAIAERDRLARLIAAGAATRQALERAEAEAAQAVANRDAAVAAVGAAWAELSAAGAQLAPAGPTAVQQTLTAPAEGRVLTVHRRGAGHVNAGEPILEIGDIDRLQAVVEVLSRDAVRIRPGMRVLIHQWGGPDTLSGIVERVEPRAFTRVSALGVEEQRVPIVIGLAPAAAGGEAADTPDAQYVLGSGYRVLAEFVIWEGERVLQVPSGALFRTIDGWAVFTVSGGRASRRDVSIGQQAGLATQITEGLEEGEVVIVHPRDRVEEGVRVREF